MTLYANWRDVPKDKWPWKNFAPREMACKGTGRLLVDDDAMNKLQALRDDLGVPMLVTSAYRSPEHNKRVGGAKNSMHLRGIAFDIRMENQNPTAFEAAARRAGFTGFGYYPKSGFMHIDTGPARTWGTPFAQTDTNLPPEAPRRSETLKEDRDVQVIGGAGVVALVSQVVTPSENGTSILDRLMSVDPMMLLVLAAVTFVAWRHMNGSPK